jgi:protein MAK16
MQSDDLIWQVIGPAFCSFRYKNASTTGQQSFCRNEFNVTGLCNRSSCPLANSQYATIREHEGSCYLYLKTVERAHLPSRLWERIKLSRNYAKALDQISSELIYWPASIKNRCIQRLTRIMQYLKRMQKLELNADSQPILEPRRSKRIRREKNRELAAEKAARIEQTIEQEVLERLRSGTYGDIYNFNQKAFENVLQQNYELEEEQEQELEEEEEREFVEDFGEDSEDDLEELFASKATPYIDDYFVGDDDESKAENGEKKEIEYEQEDLE